MPATYDNTLPTAKDRMRHALGDTDLENPLRQDETYAALLAQHPGAATAEAQATMSLALALAAEYAQQPTTFSASGSIAVSWPDRVKTWMALAALIQADLTVVSNQSSTATMSVRATRCEAGAGGAEYVRPTTWWSS